MFVRLILTVEVIVQEEHVERSFVSVLRPQRFHAIHHFGCVSGDPQREEIAESGLENHPGRLHGRSERGDVVVLDDTDNFDVFV